MNFDKVVKIENLKDLRCAINSMRQRAFEKCGHEDKEYIYLLNNL